MGLPSNESYRIAQDAKGYIWISTQAGLVKYNSKEFVLFNAEKGMPFNDVYALDADDKGRIWFATGSWDVGYILNDSVHVLPKLDFHNEKTRLSDFVYKLKCNKSTNTVYVSARHQTIEVFEKDGKFLSREVDPLQRDRDLVLLKSDKEYYIANFFNLERHRLRSKTPPLLHLSDTDSLSLPLEPVTTFFSESFVGRLKNNQLALSVLNSVVVITSTGHVVQSKQLPAQIHSLYTDSKNNLWVGCKKNGLFFFENGDLNTKPLHLLDGLSVSNIIEDAEHGIWVTTLENGVFYCSNNGVSVAQPLFDIQHGIDFCKVEDGKLWLNNNTTALAIIDKTSTIITQLLNDRNIKVTDVITAKDGYIVTTATTAYYLDKAFKNVKKIQYNKNTFMGAQGLIKTLRNETMLYNNISFYTVNSQSIVSPPAVENSVKIKHAIALENDVILFGNKQGIYRSVNKKPADKIETRAAKLVHDVNKLYRDSYNNIWVAANNDTVLVLDKNFNLRVAIPLVQKNTSCRSVLQIDANIFFLSTNMGLLQVTFSDSTFKKYGEQYFEKSNGLSSSDIYNVVQFRGSYYVSTSKGLCSFKQPSDLKYSNSPNTIISSISVNDSLMLLPHTADFSYKQNSISFHVDALAFKKMGQRGSFYKYRLEGWDDEFKIATGSTVDYDNLPPGEYKFIAKTFYDDNVEDTTPAEFSFTIKPAFWQTWWGVASIAIAIATAIVLFVQWRIKKIRLVEKEKTKVSQTIAEYKFTALKAQMDPHFVFNSINVIQNLILEKDKIEAYNSLNKFSHLIRMILNQSDSAFSTLEEELALIKLYIELNQLRIEYPFTFNSEIAPDLLTIAVPSLLIQPFIENALWHGILPFKGKKVGRINLTIFSEKKDVIAIRIQDNGIGRAASAASKPLSTHTSKGIELIKERLKAYQSMNDNCLAELNIVDLEENGEPTGTLVEMKITVSDE